MLPDPQSELGGKTMRRLALFGMAMSAMIPGSSIAAEIHTVTMSGLAYAPAKLTARVGDTIHFVNDDTATHVVFAPTAGHAIDLGAQEPGTEKTLPLMKPGTFEVECVNHDHMLLTVEVKP
jgi:plastocyanin